MAFEFFTQDLGIDLGTSNVLIYVDGKGVVIRDPAVVAVDMASQMIFDTKADLIAYKEKVHAEQSAKQPY